MNKKRIDKHIEKYLVVPANRKYKKKMHIAELFIFFFGEDYMIGKVTIKKGSKKKKKKKINTKKNKYLQ